MLKLLLPAGSKPKLGSHYKSNAKNKRLLKVYRYNDSAGPTIDTFEVESSKGKTVLQALDEIKSSSDPSLSYRKSCREGACGSCGMNINKTNRLACTTKLDDLKGDVEIYPLPHAKAIKDLVCDMSGFFRQYERMKPWLITEEKVVNSEEGAIDDKHSSKKIIATDGQGKCSSAGGTMCSGSSQKEGNCTNQETLQTPQERKKLDGLYECIMCACCSTQCPSYWWNEGDFAGPAALIQSLRFVKDSRDLGKEERKQIVKELGGLDHCHTIFSCTTVCPKGLNPAKAIRELKLITNK